MGLWSILLIAFALAFDAFAVALAAGFNLREVTRRQTFRLAFHFGLFQAMMNFFGWAGGLTFRSFIENVDHWVAFALLSAVGLHMIRGAIRDNDDKGIVRDPTRGKSLVVLSVATSIDALAVGLTFSMLNIAILLPAVVIGLVAFVMTAIGMHLGRIVSSFSKLGAEAEFVGGVVLIGIGIKILWSHGVF